MEGIYQTDDFWGQYASENPHQWCYFLSTLWVFATRINDSFWSHEGIEDIWKKAEQFHDLDADGATVLNPQGLAELVVPSRMHFEGHQPVSYPLASNQAMIMVYHKPGANFNHFVVTSTCCILYDPWSAQGSDSVRNGIGIETRVWTII